MVSLNGKTALITGGTRGIGLAAAQRLARDGARVIINGTAKGKLDAQAQSWLDEHCDVARHIAADIGDPTGVRALFDAAEEAFGQIDILVATAGTMRPAKIAAATLEDYDFNFAVNARGAFLTLSEAARRVRDGGRIIAFSTNLTRLPRAAMGLYQASKAAVEQMVFSLARELGDRGVTVNAIAPGGTDTSMLSDARRVEVAAATPLGRVATPGDIADVVAFLASDDSRWINGQVVGVNGGIV